MGDSHDIVTIYRAAHITEAHLVKNLLGDVGVEASVDEGNEPLAGLPITPVLVSIREEDLEKARPIVDRYEEEQIARGERPDWTCPSCGKTVLGALDQCESCGADRSPEEDDEDDDEDDDEG